MRYKRGKGDCESCRRTAQCWACRVPRCACLVLQELVDIIPGTLNVNRSLALLSLVGTVAPGLLAEVTASVVESPEWGGVGMVTA